LATRHSTAVLATQCDSYVKRPLNAVSSIWTVVAVAIKAFETAEFTDGKDWVKQLTDAELFRIAARGTPPRLLSMRSRRSRHGNHPPTMAALAIPVVSLWSSTVVARQIWV
jgi:hypothetical protein